MRHLVTIEHMAPKVQRVARVLPVAAEPLALPLQVVAVLVIPIFSIFGSSVARAIFLVLVGALAVFALVVGVEVTHRPQATWGTAVMWMVLSAVLAAETALMFYALALR